MYRLKTHLHYYRYVGSHLHNDAGGLIDESKALPTRFSAKFVADKTYIMVGCLGGIGRSLTRWMFGQGARSFVMLGRSATDKRSAAELVQDLRALGADVRVVRGDVSNLIDVHKALSAAPSPIGGVVQASMYLHVGFYLLLHFYEAIYN